MGAVLNRILEFAGFYGEEPETYDPRENNTGDGGGYFDNNSGYQDDADQDEGTLNDRFRNGYPGSGGGAGGGGGRASAKVPVNNVVNMPQKPQNYVLVSAKPDRLEDAQLVCEHLRDRHVVIVNVEGLEGREAQRIVDFIGGALFALNGEIFDITNRIFAVAPSHVDLVSIQRDTKNRGFLSAFGGGGNYRG